VPGAVQCTVPLLIHETVYSAGCSAVQCTVPLLIHETVYSAGCSAVQCSAVHSVFIDT